MGQMLDRLRKQLESAQVLRQEIEAEHFRVVIAIDEELARAGQSEEFGADEISLTDTTIYESPLGSHRLSGLLTQLSFPSIRSKHVSHYTSFEAFQKILHGQELRLYSVYKRIAEDELRSFLDGFGLRAATDADPISGRPVYEELSSKVFYASFSKDQDSPHLWSHFGTSNTGVRLDFCIDAQVEDFRKVSYSG